MKQVEIYGIKNGVAAHDKETGLTAHGMNEELARENLEYTLALYKRALNRYTQAQTLSGDNK